MALVPKFEPSFDSNGDPEFEPSFIDNSVSLVIPNVTRNRTVSVGSVTSSIVTEVRFEANFDTNGDPEFEPSFTVSSVSISIPNVVRNRTVSTGSVTQVADAITVQHDIENGNVDPASITITDGSTLTPTIEFDTLDSIYPIWRHFSLSIQNASGKSPTFKVNRSSKDGSTYIDPAYKPVYTTDFVTWVQADTVVLTGGVTGTIDFTFTSMPSGTVYVASSPYFRQTDAVSFAADLLSTYSSIAAPTASANANGVYATTPSVDNAFGTESGLNNQFSIRLSWSGSTTDGKAKRKAVLVSGIHGAGAAQSDIVFRESVLWMLNNASQQAQDFRSNFDVYLYFLVNPDGHKAGEAKTTPSSETDPNRAWNSAGNSTLQIITDLQDAIIADTGGSAELFLSYLGDVYSTETFSMWMTSGDNNPQTRHPTTQQIITQGMSIFNAVPDVTSVTDTTTDVAWAYAALNVKSALGIGVAAAGRTTIAHYQDISSKWLQTIAAADAQNAFTSTYITVPNVTRVRTVSVGTVTVLNEITVANITRNRTVSVGVITPVNNIVIADVTRNRAVSLGAVTLYAPGDILLPNVTRNRTVSIGAVILTSAEKKIPITNAVRIWMKKAKPEVGMKTAKPKIRMKI